MLSIEIPERRLFDETTEEFITIKATKLQMEHSLLSLKKWESKWHKAFLKKEEKTEEELYDYMRCMTLTPNVDPLIFRFMDSETAKKITDYIEDPMTATIIHQSDGAPIKKGDVVTAELFYYWMITLNIPVEFQKWHLNQLITLINVIGIKNANQKPRKLSAAEQRAEIAKRDALNEQRKAKYKTRG